MTDPADSRLWNLLGWLLLALILCGLGARLWVVAVRERYQLDIPGL